MALRRRVFGGIWVIIVVLAMAVPSQALQLFGLDQEIRVGQDVAHQLEAEYGVYTAEPELIERISKIGHKLAGASSRPNLPYSFQILDTDDINALAAPGGFIYIYRGLLEVIDDDHELASVLAHEVAHVANRHGMTQLEKNIGMSLGLSLILKLVVQDDSDLQLWQRVGDLGFTLLTRGYSRENEHDADLTGVGLMQSAGYDPAGMVRFLQKLQNLEQREPSKLEVLFQTHPPTIERISQIKQNL